jgi:hypothetical protein
MILVGAAKTTGCVDAWRSLPPTASFRAFTVPWQVAYSRPEEDNCEIDLEVPANQVHMTMHKRGAWLGGVAEGRQICLVFGGGGGRRRGTCVCVCTCCIAHPKSLL